MNKLMKKLKSDKGMSIVEVAVGMAVFGFSMCGLAHMGYSTVMTNQSSSFTTRATSCAQEQIEVVKSTDFDVLEDIAGTESYNSIEQYPLFKRITTVSSTGDDDTRTVSVQVFWARDRHHFEIRTVVSRAGA